MSSEKKRNAPFLNIPKSWEPLIGFSYEAVKKNGEPKYKTRGGTPDTRQIDLYDLAILDEIRSYTMRGNKPCFLDSAEKLAVTVGKRGAAKEVADRVLQLLHLGLLTARYQSVTIKGEAHIALCFAIDLSVINGLLEAINTQRKTEREEELIRLQYGENLRVCKPYLSLQEYLQEYLQKYLQEERQEQKQDHLQEEGQEIVPRPGNGIADIALTGISQKRIPFPPAQSKPAVPPSPLPDTDPDYFYKLSGRYEERDKLTINHFTDPIEGDLPEGVHIEDYTQVHPVDVYADDFDDTPLPDEHKELPTSQEMYDIITEWVDNQTFADDAYIARCLIQKYAQGNLDWAKQQADNGYPEYLQATYEAVQKELQREEDSPF